MMKQFTTQDIVNDENLIDIDEDLWLELNQVMSKDEIKQLISDAIENHKVRMPMIQITEDEMRQAFEDLKNLDTTDLIKEGVFTSRYPFQANL